MPAVAVIYEKVGYAIVPNDETAGPVKVCLPLRWEQLEQGINEPMAQNKPFWGVDNTACTITRSLAEDDFQMATLARVIRIRSQQGLLVMPILARTPPEETAMN